jgi:hypothetical protein
MNIEILTAVLIVKYPPIAKMNVPGSITIVIIKGQ